MLSVLVSLLANSRRQHWHLQLQACTSCSAQAGGRQGTVYFSGGAGSLSFAAPPEPSGLQAAPPPVSWCALSPWQRCWQVHACCQYAVCICMPTGAHIPQPPACQSASGLCGRWMRWQSRARSLQRRLKAYGMAGLVSYGICNTLYYTCAFIFIWCYIVQVPRGEGHLSTMAADACLYDCSLTGTAVQCTTSIWLVYAINQAERSGI